jgi:hypothetical protein
VYYDSVITIYKLAVILAHDGQKKRKNLQMIKLDVKHYLDIYTVRKEMQEENITNPSEEIKKFTNDFVKKLQNMELDEEIVLKDSSFFDSIGNLIMKIPN